MDIARSLAVKLSSFSVFRNILKDKVIEAFIELALSDDPVKKAALYGEFASSLYKSTPNLSDYIFNILADDENVFVKMTAAGKEVPSVIRESAERELEVLNSLSNLTFNDIYPVVGYDGFLPSFETSNINIKEKYLKRLKNISKYGYGVYSKYRAFKVENGVIVPVKNPDPICLRDLSGYVRERNAVIDNTKALLLGKPAANILLSGDAGTGKSSTVKAVANEFKDEGLRIVEVRKEQLVDIPFVIEELSLNPLKFILFIDDLSFSRADDNFNALKAILEGSVSAKSENVVIYATSNRRHIVRESFSDRDGDDIHRNDTIGELMSLSERFGLLITFVKPDKACYLSIAENIAKQRGIDCDNEEFKNEAEKFALKKGGRSARVARQFVDSLRAK